MEENFGLWLLVGVLIGYIISAELYRLSVSERVFNLLNKRITMNLNIIFDEKDIEILLRGFGVRATVIIDYSERYIRIELPRRLRKDIREKIEERIRTAGIMMRVDIVYRLWFWQNVFRRVKIEMKDYRKKLKKN